jgi:branched-chain amino acid transport system substrate-binding protein
MIKNTKLLLSIFAIFFISYVMSIVNNSFGKVESNIRIFMDKTGPDPARKNDKIKIGLLLPVPPEKDLLSRSAMQGAELAVEMANANGGFKGAQYEIVVRTADGLWGAGSKASVDFVHNDNVLAIVTAVDGRNAHLAEQVASKSQVVQIATRATEETLSQAYVPWFFRIVPNDRQQAHALIDEIYVKQKLSNVYLIYEPGYDFENGAKTFRKILKKRGFKINGHSAFPSSHIEISSVIKENTEALVVFGTYQNARPLLDILKDKNASLKVFGSLNMTNDGMIGANYSQGCEGGIFVSSNFCFTTAGQIFKDRYQEKYGTMPNPSASYAYDGVNLLIEAVQKSGPDRVGISDALRGIEFNNAATGPIRFDKNGNRTTPVFMIQLIKGHPVILNH